LHADGGVRVVRGLKENRRCSKRIRIAEKIRSSQCIVKQRKGKGIRDGEQKANDTREIDECLPPAAAELFFERAKGMHDSSLNFECMIRKQGARIRDS
jgi:hypothetical protein